MPYRPDPLEFDTQVGLTKLELEAVLMALHRLKLSRPSSPASESASAKVGQALAIAGGVMGDPDTAETHAAIYEGA